MLLDYYPVFVAGCLGVIVGSFLNALLYRYRTGVSVLRGRSRCMRCGHTLRAVDLVPLLSYLFLRGRCRYCGTRISAQYPVVEAAGLLLGVLIYLEHPEPVAFAYWMLVWFTLLFVVVYDLRHQIIPWSASILLSVLALGGLLAPCLGGSCDLMPLDIWAGPLLALPLFLFALVSRGTWMGWGDAPLQLGLGWLLGFWGGLSALLGAFWSGALVGIAILLLSKGFTMKSEVPFAPFLIFGAWCVHFLHVDFFYSIAALL
jgi:leader peptidase (prepilin peptidase) / N-methyltransferase